MDGFIALFTQRPYVVVFFVAFALLSWSERGGRPTLVWLLLGTTLGWLSELCSINTGFPFGHYTYHQADFPSELWIGPVPLFASLSFAFMSYFAFSAACRLLAPQGAAGRRHAGSLGDAVSTTLLAAIIGTWMDMVIDPLSLIGEYWFLGDLYHYDPPGPHFGVPFTNYFGWIVTIGSIVAMNQLVDHWEARRGVPLRRGPSLPFQSAWGPSCCAGVFLFMLSINIYLLARGTVPATVPLVHILVSGIVLFAFFAIFVVLMLRRTGERTRLVTSTASG